MSRVGPSRVGLVTGLVLEGRLAERAVPDLFEAKTVKAVAIGGQPTRAQAAVRELAAAGASYIVSFGYAGALRSGLAPGALLLPRRVVLENGDALALGDGDGLYDRAAENLSTELPLVYGNLLTVRSALTKAAEKQAAGKSSGAVAVDMESYWVAEASLAEGLPVLAVRAVSDPAEQDIPRAAAKAMTPDGKLDMAGLIGELLQRPGDLPTLLSLARHSRKAGAALSGAARLLLPFLCRS